MADPPVTLTPSELHILLSLLKEERHGYAIMQAVGELTEQSIRLGPGTLYGAIKRLIERGLMEESGDRPAAELDDERRRYYRLTGSGRSAVCDQMRDLERIMKYAKQHLRFAAGARS